MSICVYLRALIAGLFSRMAILVLIGSGGAVLAQPTLRIMIVEGDGAINNVRMHTTHDPVVEIRDEQDGLVTGASVTFQTPSAGPSADFVDGMRTFITQTDAEGRAAVHGLRPNSITGPYEIRVTASFKTQTASAVITQTNAAPAEAKSSKKIWLIGLAVGAVAGGAFAATHGGGSSSSTATSTTGSIVPGTPSFGPPH